MSGGLRLDVPAEFAEVIADAVAARLQASALSPAPLPTAEAGRLALSKAEAAEALGISVDHLDRHVLPELRIVRSGRLRLIPRSELEGWLEANAARLGEWR